MKLLNNYCETTIKTTALLSTEKHFMWVFKNINVIVCLLLIFRCANQGQKLVILFHGIPLKCSEFLAQA